MKRKIILGILALVLIGGGIAPLFPRAAAQEPAARTAEIERLRRELGRKLDRISRTLAEIQKKLVRMDRRIGDLERSIK